MKKLFLIIIISLSAYGISHSQELGLRFGDISGGNVAIDGVFSLGQFSRVHADVSFGDSGLGIDALWDFIYRPIDGEAFYWYVGVGPYVWIDDPFWLGAVGELGMEYRFNKIPIVIGADWRPSVSLIEETDFHGGGFGLNIRYNFGK